MPETTPHDLESVIRDWDGEASIARFDRESGAWIFIALHSTALGPALGGTRMRIYPTPADGLRDAQRLAESMTSKWATLEQPMGGGKAVLAIPAPLEGEARRGLLRRYGRLVESLRGTFGTGEDLGTTPEDLAVVAESTRYVHGVEPGGSVTDPGPFTARAVRRGIEAAVRHVLARDDLRGVTVLVQGVGDVGYPLARELAELGARLLVSDVDSGRIERAVTTLGATAVAPEEAWDAPCDVFAPCAIGGVLSSSTIPRLQCRIVAGSANAQLETREDEARLAERGIVYVPDYVVNAGGAYAFALLGRGEHDEATLFGRMDYVGEIVAAVLAESKAEGTSPLEAAGRRVARALSRGRAPAS
ncbi:MAG TPA: Glu/Leu/Phe/Val dehydrogenase dimerization domain-containing protein [Thermoanaerobaculia bacterium]|jgi:leucine dehydrogenase|nr:Glu/Leu/Phe/Val dehydrogenase dimerization domain-containing protein [Thermoanaerobaculia bacterium]